MIHIKGNKKYTTPYTIEEEGQIKDLLDKYSIKQLKIWLKEDLNKSDKEIEIYIKHISILKEFL
jgi:hypothetical protein